jgi:ABC-type transporter Mla MlaB component
MNWRLQAEIDLMQAARAWVGARPVPNPERRGAQARMRGAAVARSAGQPLGSPMEVVHQARPRAEPVWRGAERNAPCWPRSVAFPPGVSRGTHPDRYAAPVPTPELAVTVVKTGEHSALRLAGTLDLAKVDHLVADGAQILYATSETLTLDVGGVDFCDSTGLAGLVKIRNSARGAWRAGLHPRPATPYAPAPDHHWLASAFGVPDARPQTSEE